MMGTRNRLSSPFEWSHNTKVKMHPTSCEETGKRTLLYCLHDGRFYVVRWMVSKTALSSLPVLRCVLDGVKDGTLIVAGSTLCVGWCQRRNSRRCRFDVVRWMVSKTALGSAHGIMEGVDALIPSRRHIPSKKVPSDSLYGSFGNADPSG